MRIAIVRRVCSLQKAGAERYCVNLFRQLQRLGHDVTVVGEAIDDDLRREVAFLKVPVNHWTSWTKNRSFARNAAAVVSAHSFDVVHGLSRVDGLDTYRLTDPLQTHWVQVYYRGGWRRRLERWNPRHQAIFRIEERLFGPTGPRRILVQSELDARLVRDYFGVAPERLRLVRNGVDLSVFQPDDGSSRAVIREELGLSTSHSLLVFASMDFRRKGLDSLLHALARCRSANTILAVLGTGDIPAYRELAGRLGLRERVCFLGRRSDMPRFYRAADAFVLPTIYEPFPNVNLEAMACGTPVITTATAGGADIVAPGDNGFLVSNTWAIAELADRIDQFVSLSRAERARMSAACIETARKYPVQRNAQETAAILEDVRREKLCA